MLRFIHITDTHIHTDESYILPYARYAPIVGARQLVTQVNALGFTPDFILHTGDIAYDPVPEVYPTIKDLFGGLKAPVYYIAGNHDHRETVQTLLMRRDELQVYPHYELDIKGVQCVFVDSNASEVMPHGRVSEEQLEWLDALCASDDDRPMMIAVHHNPLAVGVPWMDTHMKIENGEEFHAIVRQARDRLGGVFHGHIHQEYDVLRDGVLYSSGASPWCAFKAEPHEASTQFLADPQATAGFSVVTITPQQTTVRRHQFTVQV